MYFVGLILLLFNTVLASPGYFPAPKQTQVEITTSDDRRGLNSGQDLALSKTLLTIKSNGKLMLRNLGIDNTSDLIIESGGVLVVEGDLSTEN